MICTPCRERRHDRCKGGTWCDCQHQPGSALPPASSPPPEPELYSNPAEVLAALGQSKGKA